jgi:RNA polymerase sigma factor (TIGR02999 family)
MKPREEAPPAGSAALMTQLLNEAGQGDPAAAATLLPLVYDQLRRLAEAKMRQERPDQTLQATALVHEAYLRLVDPQDQRNWGGRWQFFTAAAEAMRHILIDRARRRSRLKRGGGCARVSLDHAEDLTITEPPDDLLALDEALTELVQKHPDKAQLVKLRFFAGLTIAEVAQAMEISTATADRHWAYARAWLHRRMKSH